jgi:hypothetical protein
VFFVAAQAKQEPFKDKPPYSCCEKDIDLRSEQTKNKKTYVPVQVAAAETSVILGRYRTLMVQLSFPISFECEITDRKQPCHGAFGVELKHSPHQYKAGSDPVAPTIQDLFVVRWPEYRCGSGRHAGKDDYVTVQYTAVYPNDWHLGSDPFGLTGLMKFKLTTPVNKGAIAREFEGYVDTKGKNTVIVEPGRDWRKP